MTQKYKLIQNNSTIIVENISTTHSIISSSNLISLQLFFILGHLFLCLSLIHINSHFLYHNIWWHIISYCTMLILWLLTYDKRNNAPAKKKKWWPCPTLWKLWTCVITWQGRIQVTNVVKVANQLTLKLS